MRTPPQSSAIRVAALCLLAALPFSVPAATVFQDAFTNFVLSATWQAHGAGAPDLVTGIVGVGADGSSLRIGSSPGTAGEITGIQLANPFPIAGIRAIRVTARVRPLNQTGAGDGGASDASAGVALIGASGAFARASAGANRASAPDWGDFYVDSDGVYNANSVAFAHFPPNDPDGGAEAFRTFVLEINENGTTLNTLSSSGQPLAVSPFRVVNPNLTLASYGNSVNVALFQQRSDANSAPENSFGDIDSVRVEIEADQVVIFDDRFEPAEAGPGPNWEPAETGLPNVVSDRIALDGNHTGLRLATQDPTGAKYGVQLATPLAIPADATGLQVDFLVQPRNGGAYDAQLMLLDLNDNDSLAVSFNEFSGGQVRRFAALGNVASKAIDVRSPADYAFSPYTFYHAVVSIGSSGTTVRFTSEDSTTVHETLSVPELTISNLLGSSLRLAILLSDLPNSADGDTQPESFIDRLTVTVLTAPPAPLVIAIATGGNVIEDSRAAATRHDGVNYGAIWATTNVDSAAVARPGVMQFSANATNQITLTTSPDFNSPGGTIMFWMRSAGANGSGNEGAMLFDRRPRNTNGPPGAVLVLNDAGRILLQAASGNGIAGFPNEVNDRITLDDSHKGLRMRANDLSGTVFGIQLAAPLEIPVNETELKVDLLVQNRSGGAYPARLVLRPSQGNKSLTVSLNEASGAAPRQMVAFGTGGGGAFDQASAESIHSPYNFYRILVAISSTGTTVDLASEDSSAVFHSFSIPELTIADLAGTSLQLSILQAANTAGGATEALVDNLTVTSTAAGVILDDPFEPGGAGPGANWVAATGNGLANQVQSTGTLADDHWHHVALVYDQSATGTASLFIDGVANSSATNTQAWAWPEWQIELGRSHDAYWRAYSGALDDFRIYNRVLTAGEIASAHSADAIVDASALAVRFNFDNAPSGFTLAWPGNATLETTPSFAEPIIWSPVPNSRSPFYMRPNDEAVRFYRAIGQ